MVTVQYENESIICCHHVNRNARPGRRRLRRTPGGVCADIFGPAAACRAAGLCLSQPGALSGSARSTSRNKCAQSRPGPDCSGRHSRDSNAASRAEGGSGPASGARPELRLDAGLLGLERRRLGMGQWKLGRSALGRRGLGAWPLGLAPLPLFLDRRPLAVREKARDSIPRQVSFRPICGGL